MCVCLCVLVTAHLSLEMLQSMVVFLLVLTMMNGRLMAELAAGEPCVASLSLLRLIRFLNDNTYDNRIHYTLTTSLSFSLPATLILLLLLSSALFSADTLSVLPTLAKHHIHMYRSNTNCHSHGLQQDQNKTLQVNYTHNSTTDKKQHIIHTYKNKISSVLYILLLNVLLS